MTTTAGAGTVGATASTAGAGTVGATGAGDTTGALGSSGTLLVPEGCTLRERKKLQTRQALHDAALTLVSERGLDGVTIDQICAHADVSPRTFFNYFTSKAHAALGLDTVEVPEDAATRFTTAEGRLIDDVCRLVASTVPLSQDRRRTKELLVLRPEMSAMVMQWMAESRQSLLATVSTRTDEQTARTAVALVMSALSEVAHRDTVRSNDELATRLGAVVTEMVALGSV